MDLQIQTKSTVNMSTSTPIYGFEYNRLPGHLLVLPGPGPGSGGPGFGYATGL